MTTPKRLLAALMRSRGSHRYSYEQCESLAFMQQQWRCIHNTGGSSSSGDDAAAADAHHHKPLPPPFTARLASRAVIVMEGSDSLAFLQGMVSNDVRPLAAPGAGPVYAAITSPKGKLLHDVFIYRGDKQQPDDGGADHDGGAGTPQRLWLDVDAGGAPAALAWLARYKLRRAIALERADADELSVWARHPAASSSSSSSSSSNSGWFADPRLPASLGERGVFRSGAAAVAAAAGTADAAAAAAAARHHRRLRYRLGVAEGDGELLSGQLAPADANLDALAGVSYTKGCYIGQERSSFTHFRGVVRRRVMPVTLPASAQACKPGAEIVSSGGGGTVGTLLASEGSLGLAYLRLTPALAAAAVEGGGGGAPRLHIAGDEAATVVPSRPGWWPAEWGHEEDGASAAAAAATGSSRNAG